MSLSIGGVTAPSYADFSQFQRGDNSLAAPEAVGAILQGEKPTAPDTKAQQQQGSGTSEGKDGKQKNGRCQTCDSRKYQDGSNDPGVSFKSPTNIRPEAAATAVMAHEQEHVTREKQKAGQEGRQVLSQSVTLHLGICPECHHSYVAGGTTRTTTAAAKQQYSANMSTGGNQSSGFAAKA